jgi:predicted MFS family arabinose efflux permease
MNDNLSNNLKPWAVFKHRDYTFLWSGLAFQSITMVLRLLISAQWLYDETKSPIWVGALGGIQLLQLPLALYGGTLADRVNRKKLMIITQGVVFISLASLTFLAASDVLKVWHIFVVTGSCTIVQMLGNSARPAMLPRVIPRELLPHGVTVQVATRQIAMVFAPILFGIVYETSGVAGAFFIASITAFLSILSPALIRASGEPNFEENRKGTISSLVEGLGFVKRHRLLPGLYLLDIGVVIFSFYRELLPVFADQLFGMGAQGTAWLAAADSVGGIIGTLLVFYMSRWPRKGFIVLVGTSMYAILLILFGINTIFILGLVIIGFLGLLDSISMVMRQTLVQLTTPDQLLGRASSVHSFAAMGANHLGTLEVGIVSSFVGAGFTMVIGGFVSVFVVIGIWYFIPNISIYRYDPENPLEK